MIEITKLKSGFKYLYLVAFFALLSGFFHPFIVEEPFEWVLLGVLVLFLGLGGAILLYKSSLVEKHQLAYFGGGFVLIAISLMLIFQITGRA